MPHLKDLSIRVLYLVSLLKCPAIIPVLITAVNYSEMSQESVLQEYSSQTADLDGNNPLPPPRPARAVHRCRSQAPDKRHTRPVPAPAAEAELEQIMEMMK